MEEGEFGGRYGVDGGATNGGVAVGAGVGFGALQVEVETPLEVC